MINNFNSQMSTQELKQKIAAGAKFVRFEYTISIVVATFKRSSGLYFIDAGESSAKFSWYLTLLTGIMGWWGIPWGPIYTIGTFITNFGGGKDYTQQVMHSLLSDEQRRASANNQATPGGYGINNQNSSGGYGINNQNNNTTGNGGYNIPR